MPDRFVIKANHGSTWNYFVTNKHTEDFSLLHKRCDKWLSQTWGKYAGEWWYGLIKPQILMEEYLDDGSGTPPKDFKFFVMRGEIKMIQVDFDRFVQHKRNLYDPHWKLFPYGLKFPTGQDVPKPHNLEEMKTVASLLGRDFDFVRVDLYSLGNRIVVGELTHAPGSGWEKFSDPKFDLWLGEQMRNP